MKISIKAAQTCEQGRPAAPRDSTYELQYAALSHRVQGRGLLATYILQRVFFLHPGVVDCWPHVLEFFSCLNNFTSLTLERLSIRVGCTAQDCPCQGTVK